MNADCLVSVLIPSYNHEKYIEKCLDSVLGQSYPNIEVLLLDDGSNDSSLEIARRWEAHHQGRFTRTLFQEQENVGITRTIERLICESKGDFVALLASDDELVQDSIVNRMDFLISAKADAVFGDAIPVDEDGLELGSSAIEGLGLRSSRQALENPRTLFWELLLRWNVYGSVLLCRRSALIMDCNKSVMNLDLYSEDMQLYYYFASRGTLRFLNQPVAKYRMHAGSTCRSPENELKLRKNIFESRRHSARSTGALKWLVLQLQMFTYYRRLPGIVGVLVKPLVFGVYLILLLARFVYDLWRVRFLGQRNSAGCA